MKGMNPDFGRPYTPPETEHHRKLSEEMVERRTYLKGANMIAKAKSSLGRISSRVRQGHLAGLEPPRIKKIDDAAEVYYDVMTARCKLTKEEDEAKDNLIDKMKEHQVDRYETPDGLVVTVTSKSNVKVKRKENGGGELDGEEE